jgi:hypothetical protein
VKAVSRRDLVVLTLGLAVAAWLLVRSTYGDLPPLRWWLPAPLALLAVAEAFAARTVRQRLRDLRSARAVGRGQAPADTRPNGPVRPVEPMLVARLAVLAQASAYVGAGFAGLWGGVLAHVAPAVGRLQVARADTVTAAIGIVCAAGLVAAALALESACRVPPEDRDPSEGVSA